MSKATRVPAVSFSLSTLFRHPTTYLGPLLAFTMTACRAPVSHGDGTAGPVLA